VAQSLFIYVCRKVSSMSNKCLLFVSAVPNKLLDIHAALKNDYMCAPLTLERFSQGSVLAIDGIVINIDFKNAKAVESLKESLAQVDRDRTFLVLVIDSDKTGDMSEALGIGADDIIYRSSHKNQPKQDWVKTVASRIKQLVGSYTHRQAQPKVLRTAIKSGDNALSYVMNFAQTGKPLEIKHLKHDVGNIIGALDEHGLDAWLDMVRTHHSATYQHSLIVTGVATAFGKALGCNAKDLERLSIGAMLHDVGKSKIPVEILEKPGPLDEFEWVVMKQHPNLGRDIIMDTGEFDPEILDIVTHHHEYLDGSGYPDNLKNGDISDIVRIMTISDIFGAMIERRSYKKEATPEKAYEILTSMTTKLEVPLVKAFGQILNTFRKAA
jgi:putative nucleotidyltransferase with HDIG domain